ncbi:hypothetical protein CBS101457_004151 [Exobasidium rhododendri]|nr:hypothetical protein CBS101457_004151 [Exobasidium rhododendri]
MSSRSHSKAYLESLLQPPPSSGTIGSRRSSLTPNASGVALSTNAVEAKHYKPTRSSGLALKGNRDEDVLGINASVRGNGDVDELLPDAQVARTSTTPASSISEDDENETFKSSIHQRTPQRQNKGRNFNGNSQSVNAILSLLDDESLDDEEKIDQVRSLLADRIGEAEGITVTATRLDNIVLALLHRHREDLRPTGASFTVPISPSPSPFPASPRSRPRPANLRTMSGNANGISRPWTPNPPTTPTTDLTAQEGGPSMPSSPLLIPQTIGIGNGSPRASPSLWHRSISNSTNLTIVANPWSQSSPVAASPSTMPLLHGTPTITTLSRPSSPGHGMAGSPRLNVSALAFKPRSSTPMSNQSTPQKSAPWLKSNDLELVGTQSTAASDSDEDEFSPFVNPVAGAVPVPGSSSSSGASGNSSIQSLTTAESISGSYHGSTTSASLESSDDQRTSKWSALSGEEDFGASAMTPFDVLSSILSTSSTGASSWSSEQIEEALETNNWDIDATLTAIMESGGMPGPNATLSRSPNLTKRGISTGGGTIVPGRSGVSLVSSESFATQRGGGVSSPGLAISSTSASASSSSAQVPSTSLAQQQEQQQQQQQQGGGVGPGRVCRYFLAGECRRADCRFSHDLNRAVCRFWMKGQCLNGEGCSFLHDMSIVDKLTNRISSMSATSGSIPQSAVAVDTPPNEEFPELGIAPTGPKAQRGKGILALTSGSSASTNDPSRTRWAQALQKKANTPLTMLQQGESHLHLHRKASDTPAKGTPTGPRNPALTPSQRGGSSAAAAASSRIPLRSPLLLPTLSTGKDASTSYVAYRELATSLSEKRNKLLARAAEAWKKGDGSEARKWSREGQSVNTSLQEESKIACRKLLRERHEELQKRLSNDSNGSRGLLDPSVEERGSRGWRGKLMGDQMGICLGVAPKISSSIVNTMSLSLEERTEVLMDLHSLHSTEAVELIEEFLISLEKENFRGLALLAIGLGRHTSQETDRRRVGLASSVREFLSSWNYPYAEHNGVIIVDPLSHF